MADLKEISGFEEFYYRLQAIKKQIDALEDYVLAQLDLGDHQPSKPVMIDPRTGKEFKS